MKHCGLLKKTKWFLVIHQHLIEFLVYILI